MSDNPALFVLVDRDGKPLLWTATDSEEAMRLRFGQGLFEWGRGDVKPEEYGLRVARVRIEEVPGGES